MSESVENLRSQILIAMPSLGDPSFNKTITLICEHSPQEGAMGVVINLPTSLNINELLNQIEIEEVNPKLKEECVHFGGPVGVDQAFILHADDAQYESTLQVAENLHLSTSKDAFEAIAQSTDFSNKIVTLGYAGWIAGQLEAEISTNSWLAINYQYDLVFNTPANKQWLAAGDVLGVNLNLLKSEAGHA